MDLCCFRSSRKLPLRLFSPEKFLCLFSPEAILFLPTEVESPEPRRLLFGSSGDSSNISSLLLRDASALGSRLLLLLSTDELLPSLLFAFLSVEESPDFLRCRVLSLSSWVNFIQH